LLSDGTTMSKSKGNYFTLGDLVAKGYSPMALRYTLLSGHPRKQLNFTLDSMHAAESALKALARFSAMLAAAPGPASVAPSALFDPVLKALADDLNTPGALGALFTAINGFDATKATTADREAFNLAMFALGLKVGADAASGPAASVPAEVASLAKRRWEAKQAKDFGAADRLRGELAAAGWSMLDGKEGYKLEPLKKT
ncbi:MAG TPA: DALR domain-containing protein, partial [Opitutaceae bacterium]